MDKYELFMKVVPLLRCDNRAYYSQIEISKNQLWNFVTNHFASKNILGLSTHGPIKGLFVYTFKSPNKKCHYRLTRDNKKITLQEIYTGEPYGPIWEEFYTPQNLGFYISEIYAYKNNK